MNPRLVCPILLLAFCGSAMAQEPDGTCRTHHNAPPISAYYWPPDTEVKVYFIRDMFSPEQQATLFAAMRTWEAASRDTRAGVKFRFVDYTVSLASCDGCLTITRREVHKFDRKHYAFFNPLKTDDAGLLISAWIDFDFATTSPQALQGFMSHELGHGMGLWDCRTCKKKQTIMNAFPGINKNNGLVEPSKCDLEVVRQVYELARRISRNSLGLPRHDAGQQPD